MKRSFAFLMALCLCFLCFATYGFESTDHSHGNENGHIVYADDPEDFGHDPEVTVTTTYLYAKLKSQTYNAATKQLVLEIEVGLSDGKAISGGLFQMEEKYKSVSLGSPRVKGKLFGVDVDVEMATSTVAIEVGTTANRPPYGTLTVTYPVLTTFRESSNRMVAFSLASSYIYRDERVITVDPQIGYLDAYACEHPYYQYKVVKLPTCGESGWMESKCTTCGMTDPVAARKAIFPLEHTLDYTKPFNINLYGYRPATCTELGYGYFRCTVCGQYQTSYIPYAPHKWGERYLEGDVWKQKCSVCGKVDNAANQCDHNTDDYVFDRVLKPSTCTEAGVAIYRCPSCDPKTEVERPLPLAEHTVAEWTATKAATCSEAGSEKGLCSVCNKEVTREIAKLAHAFGDWVVKKAATCVENGVSVQTCSKCDYKQEKTLEKSGHSFSEWATEKAPTCVEKGSEKRTCSVCQEIETRELAVTGHNFGEWKVSVAPTCSAEGKEEKICSVCNESETRVLAIDPEAHKFSEWETETAKTCTKDGVKKRICELCDKEEIGVDPCIGHVFGDPVEDKKTTTKTCICGYTETVKQVKGGIEKTLSNDVGALIITGANAGRNYVFEIERMSLTEEDYYKDNNVVFDKGYVYHVTLDGEPVEITEDMKLTMFMDESTKNSKVSVLVRRGQSVVSVTEFERKGVKLTMKGADLAGSEHMFLDWTEKKSDGIFFIIIAVLTLAIAGGVVYFIANKSNKDGAEAL